MPREQYVRPPLVAQEPPSPQAAVWRMRAIGIVLAILTLVGLIWLLLTVSGVTSGENPGIGSQAPIGTLSSALVPLGSLGSITS